MRACATGCHAGLRDNDKGMICKKCRADLELGRLVRDMQVNWDLTRDSVGWIYDCSPGGAVGSNFGDTPEEALTGKRAEKPAECQATDCEPDSPHCLVLRMTHRCRKTGGKP